MLISELTVVQMLHSICLLSRPRPFTGNQRQFKTSIFLEIAYHQMGYQVPANGKRISIVRNNPINSRTFLVSRLSTTA